MRKFILTKIAIHISKRFFLLFLWVMRFLIDYAFIVLFVIDRTSMWCYLIDWIWIRIQDVGPIWFRIQGILKEEMNINCREKQFSLKSTTKCHLKKFFRSEMVSGSRNSYDFSGSFAKQLTLFDNSHWKKFIGCRGNLRIWTWRNPRFSIQPLLS